MKKTDQYRKLYYIEEEYDLHTVTHMLKNILKVEYEQENLYKGIIISVKKEDYYKVFDFISSELLRREPEYKVNWIDYSGKQRPYNEFCYGILKIKDEYVNNEIIELAKNRLTELMNQDENTSEGKSPISVSINENGYISFDGTIVYDDKEKFWFDLRYNKLIGAFAKRREYCLDIIKNNSNTINTYADSYYLPFIDGSIDEFLDMHFEFTQTGITQKQKMKK